MDPDAMRITKVLAGLDFPALRWQILAQADYYGADAQSSAELAALPIGIYKDLSAVIRAIRARQPTGGPVPS